MLKVAVATQEFPINFRENLNEETGERTGEILATFFVKPMTPSQSKEALKQCTKYKWDGPPGKRQMKQRFEDVDYLGFAKLRMQQIIVGWEGVADIASGEPLEFSRENVLLVYEHNPEVINYVLDQADEVAKLQIEVEKDTEKNLKSGQSGKLKKGK